MISVWQNGMPLDIVTELSLSFAIMQDGKVLVERSLKTDMSAWLIACVSVKEGLTTWKYSDVTV